ncbi:MAG: toxin-antitoxin system HicB family antitoxin [Micromonosporaceae bacterium]
MELTQYLESLRRELAAAAAPGGPDVTKAAELLGGSLEASTRLLLLEALSDAAAEITAKLGDSSVEVRLRGREAQFVVTRPEPGPMGGAPPAGTEGDLARITLRLPESLKEAVERAAASEGISVNAWLVRAIAAMVAGPPGFGPPGFGPPGFGPPGGPGSGLPPAGRGRSSRRISGFAQA